MTYLITILFALSSLFAAPVEMSFPEFSKKVRNQGTDDSLDKGECKVQKSDDGRTSTMTCGTNVSASATDTQGRDLGQESSPYAQEQMNKARRERR